MQRIEKISVQEETLAIDSLVAFLQILSALLLMCQLPLAPIEYLFLICIPLDTYCEPDEMALIFYQAILVRLLSELLMKGEYYEKSARYYGK
jgi:hypothetical protein